MKIGIITYWYSKNNYGQLLQCFALQQAIRNIGHEPYLILFKPSVPLFVRMKRKIRNLFKKKGDKSDKKSMQGGASDAREFDLFVKDNVSVYPQAYDSIKMLKKNPPKLDCYVCGSDQIWNVSLDNYNNSGWFLNFGKAPKIAYAPSILRMPKKKDAKKIKKYLASFNDVSVREEVGKEILGKIGICNVKVVLDPTLLLQKKDYERFIDVDHDKKTIFCYFVNLTNAKQAKLDCVKQFALGRGLSVNCTFSTGFSSSLEMARVLKNTPLTIPEWLSFVNNSEYVVTSSFHGVVFSVIFHKKFAVIPIDNNDRGANGRLENLLSRLGLLDRLFRGNDVSFIENDIDWNSVDKRLSELRNESFSYLEESLSSVRQ